MTNTSATWQQAARITQLSSLSCLTRAIQKSLSILQQTKLENFLKRLKESGEWTISRNMTRQNNKTTKTKKARGLG